MTKLDVGLCALVFGCAWGLLVWALGILSARSNRAAKIVSFLAQVYVGYRTTLKGSLIGVIWGFVDGAISGALIAWIYNIIVF